MFVFHPLSTGTRELLLAGALDPDDIAAVVRHAVREDLMGGVDVTTVATIPAGQRSVATFGAREAGVVAGLPVVNRRRSERCFAVTTRRLIERRGFDS